MKFLIILVAMISCATYDKQVTIEQPASAPAENDSIVLTSGYELKTTNSKIIESVKLADCVTHNKDYHAEIIAFNKYSHFEGDNKEIVASLLSDKKAIVSSYYKKYSVWPVLSKASAYRIPNTDKIYINRAKLGSFEATVESLLHEKLHVLNYKHDGNGRNINNNINSVPYMVSVMAGKYVEGCK